LGLMPFTLLFFSGFFPVALLCNLFAVPLVSFITLPLSLLATFLLLFKASLSIDSLFIHSVISYALYLSELSINVLLACLSAIATIAPKNQTITLSVFVTLNIFLLVLCLLSPLPFRLKLLSLIFF